MKRSKISVSWIAFVTCLGFAACSPAVVPSDEDQNLDDGSGGSNAGSERGGSKGKGGSAGGASSTVGSAGKTSNKGGNAGSSGEGGDEGSGGSDEKGGSNEKGGSQAGGSKSPDAGKGDGALGNGGVKTGSDASVGAGGAKGVGGGSSKEAGAGGATVTGPTPCSFPSGWKPGSPTYTTYNFAQGTYQVDGKYQTACGYQGTRPNNTDTVVNIVNANRFAAIPGNSSKDFSTKDRCGACIQIGSSVITIIDQCPMDTNSPCKNNPTGHLDLSDQAASSGGVQGNPQLGGQAAWKFVPCPVNGNVVVRLKKDNDNEIYIENTIMPLQSVTCDGETGSRTSYGSWHFENNLNGCTMTLTDVAGRSIDVKAGETQDQNVDTGVQFPKCQ